MLTIHFIDYLLLCICYRFKYVRKYSNEKRMYKISSGGPQNADEFVSEEKPSSDRRQVCVQLKESVVFFCVFQLLCIKTPEICYFRLAFSDDTMIPSCLRATGWLLLISQPTQRV